ncbi:MAG: PAS domain-containing protein [Polyangiaceae bacterium]|nr:PAS domain-containing protein [Polyangiaceae bacterium]
MEVMDAEGCPGLVVAMDRDGIILRANGAAERALGGRVAKGAYLAHSLHPEDRAEFANRWLELLDGAGQTKAVSRLQDAGGVQHQNYAWTANYSATRNEIRAVFVPLGDAEPRRAFRLDDPALLLRAVLHHCAISIIVVDLDGRIVLQDGNTPGAPEVGPNQLVGQSIFDLYGADLPEQMQMIRKTMTGGEVHTWKVDYLSVLWDVVCMPLRDEGGALRGALLHTIDKSDMKQAMQDVKTKLELIERQQEVIRNLETPIIQVWDHVLTLPMVGVVDSQRASRVMNDLLEMVVSKSAHYAILDLTGVDTVDTATASHLIQMVGAIRLLGAEGVISGIRPTVAQTLVSLGVDISAIKTCSNLQQALRYCIRGLGSEALGQSR